LPCRFARGAFGRTFEAPVLRGHHLPSRGLRVLRLLGFREFDQRVLDGIGRACPGRDARRFLEERFVGFGEFGDRPALRVDLRRQVPQRR
jgi:hypothetical protein